MKPITDAITGQENTNNLSPPCKALVQFYNAFNSGDMNMMSENWSQTNDIAMSNPLGGIKRGWPEIQAVYRRIFDGAATVYVEYFDYTLHETENMFYTAGRERGYFRLDSEEITLAIRTSRIYQKIEGIWKQVHHHGSIEDPQLLDSYQSAVMGRQFPAWHSPR
jgi:ketosteroid isomerase-like protein